MPWTCSGAAVDEMALTTFAQPPVAVMDDDERSIGGTCLRPIGRHEDCPGGVVRGGERSAWHVSTTGIIVFVTTYTAGTWTVKPGQEAQFVETWREMGLFAVEGVGRLGASLAG
jgi:hypothetical protein